MTNSQKHSDVRTPNAHRYRRGNASVGLDANGLPVAFRHVEALTAQGVETRFQRISARGVESSTAAAMRSADALN